MQINYVDFRETSTATSVRTSRHGHPERLGELRGENGRGGRDGAPKEEEKTQKEWQIQKSNV